MSQEYFEEAKAGASLIAVLAPEPRLVTEARQVLAAHGARHMRFYDSNASRETRVNSSLLALDTLEGDTAVNKRRSFSLNPLKVCGMVEAVRLIFSEIPLYPSACRGIVRGTGRIS
jgi:hypothetical protein